MVKPETKESTQARTLLLPQSLLCPEIAPAHSAFREPAISTVRSLAVLCVSLQRTAVLVLPLKLSCEFGIHLGGEQMWQERAANLGTLGSVCPSPF